MISADTAAVIAKAARNFGDKIALVDWDTGVRRSFRETDERVNRLANALLGLGLKKEDTVATVNRNCPEHVEMMFAAIKSGAKRTHVNPRLTPEDLAWLLNDAETKFLFVSEQYMETIQKLRPQLKTVKHIISISGKAPDTLDYEELLAGSSPEAPNLTLDDDELGQLWYTAGTTGKPKGVALPRRSDMAVTRNTLLDMLPHLNEDDAFLALQPLYHGAGLFILAAWIRGLKHVTVHRYDPEIAYPAVEKEKITFIKTVPTVLVRFLTHADIDKHDLSSLRTIVYGAAPMPVDKLKDGLRRFGQIFIQGYGQSEALGTIATLSRKDHRLEGTPEQTARLAAVGRPYTYVDVRVVDESGKGVPTGEAGEVIVRGDHIMKSYWKVPQEVTDDKLRDGWIYTGDIGKFDNDNYLFLVDRKGQMIISGGLNVFPNEVEQVLYQYKGVLEASVFGIPDEQWGEAVKAVVALKPGTKVTEAELITFCRDRIAHYKAPKSIDFRDSLPKSDSGKILTKELKAPYWKGRDRQIN
ncbi:MAG: long-chain-fatty-acid--CoA ligase [Chloroflexota bacterium]